MIGLATALQSRSATMVDARSRSRSRGFLSTPSHEKMSRSRSLVRIRQIVVNSESRSAAFIFTGSLPSSIRPMRFLLTSARPISRSTANGGAVHIRSVGKILGLDLRVAASRQLRLLVATSAALTCSVVLIRVDLNALGANCMNHWLNWSTEAAMSAFQRCGL